MADPTTDDTTTPYVPRCPWCSAELPDPDAKTCPTCNANLAGEGETQVPGLTALDLERLAFRRSTTPKKSRLLSWISGDSDYEDATDPVAAPGSLDLPPNRGAPRDAPARDGRAHRRPDRRGRCARRRRRRCSRTDPVAAGSARPNRRGPPGRAVHAELGLGTTCRCSTPTLHPRAGDADRCRRDERLERC